MKVYCKKDVSFAIAHKLFSAGNYYTITKSFMNAIYVDNVLFWTNSNGEPNVHYFNDYFYTMKELRKVKLDNLNKKRWLQVVFNKLKMWTRNEGRR